MHSTEPEPIGKSSYLNLRNGRLSGPELERLRQEMSAKNKRIRELEMERDVLKLCMVLWVK